MNWGKNLAEMEAGLIKNIADMEAGLMRRRLLKWKRDWWKYFWNGSGIGEKNIAEIEARIDEKDIAEMDWWKEDCWNGSDIDEKNIGKM